MQVIVIVATVAHVLPAVAWAGFTFALARTAAANVERLFALQLGSAGVAILGGVWLWSLNHGGGFGPAERLLALGALAAIAAFAAQAVSTGPVLRRLGEHPELRRRAAVGQRVSAGLLVVAILCMTSARYV
jgi:hypothetical protein